VLDCANSPPPRYFPTTVALHRTQDNTVTRFRPQPRPKVRADAASGGLEAAQPPDEQIYAQLTDALDRRRIRLERLRLELGDIRSILNTFESDCQSRVGDLVAQLRDTAAESERIRQRLKRLVTLAGEAGDDVLEQLVEELGFGIDPEADLGPFDPEPGADDGDIPGGDPFRGQEIPPSRARDGQDPVTRAQLRRLYRDLARRCHPDLAGDHADRSRREALMQRVNEAFDAGDAEALRAMLLETEAEDPAFAERPIADRLAWARAELARLDRQLDQLRREMTEVQVSDLYRLWRRHESGAPVFEDLEADLERRIRAEVRILDRLVASYRAVVSDHRLEEELDGAARAD
jgi:hypothetical protein